MRVGVSNNPPYAIKAKKIGWFGEDIEIIRRMSTFAGCQINFVEASFAERLLLLQKGAIDVMFGVSKLKQRSVYMDYIGPVRTEQLSLVTTNKVRVEIDNLIAISQSSYYFGKPENAFLGEKFAAQSASDPIFPTKFINIKNNSDIYELISKGRIAGFFAESKSLDYRLANDSGLSGFKKHPLNLMTGQTYIAISKKSVSSELFLKLQQAFNEVKLQKH